MTLSFAVTRSAAIALLGSACSTSPAIPRADAPSSPATVSTRDRTAADFPLDWTTPDRLAEDCAGGIQRVEAIWRALKRGERPLQSDDALRRWLDRLGGGASLIAAVHPEASVRTAAEECERSVQRISTTISLDRDVFDALDSTDPQALDRLGRRARARALKRFKRAGVDRDAATRARLKALSNAMVRLSQDFSRAIRDDTRTIRVDAAALQGLPEDFVASHPAGKDGKVALTTDYPDFFPVQRYARQESVRRALYTEYLNRGYPMNEGHLKKLLTLRRKYAQALGYENWADYDAAEKMAKSGARIEKFLGDLEAIVAPRNKADLEVLLARKRRDDPTASSIQVWDRFYYVGRVRAEQYAFDARSVRPYFEFRRVTRGLMDLYGELFGVTFERDEEASVWHPSVLAYRLKAGTKLLGRFYLDMHPRPGKYGHAAMFPIQTGVAPSDHGEGQLAIASLVCNFPDPAKPSPALMEHNQVVTYFHEFGHLIHHLLATGSPYVSLGGISTEWDFVEAPSQLLEEWAWDPDVLARFARHVDTQQPIPRQVVQRMRRSAEFGKGVQVQRQLYYAALSYYLHTADPENLDVLAFQRKMIGRYLPYPYPPNTNGYASFGHLAGYSSAYYTYQWSLVLAKDIFTRFAQEGLLNAKTARDYRQAVLLPGGSKDANDLVKDFLGRPSNLDAYRAWLTNE